MYMHILHIYIYIHQCIQTCNMYKHSWCKHASGLQPFSWPWKQVDSRNVNGFGQLQLGFSSGLQGMVIILDVNSISPTSFLRWHGVVTIDFPILGCQAPRIFWQARGPFSMDSRFASLSLALSFSVSLCVVFLLLNVHLSFPCLIISHLRHSDWKVGMLHKLVTLCVMVTSSAETPLDWVIRLGQECQATASWLVIVSDGQWWLMMRWWRFIQRDD